MKGILAVVLFWSFVIMCWAMPTWMLAWVGCLFFIILISLAIYWLVEEW